MDLERLKRDAESGDPGALYNLGVWHLGEAGRPPDPGAARRCFAAAAAADYAPAHSALGYLYLRGAGGDPDPVRARDCFQQAAGAGFAEAAYRLGELHATGLGGDTDPQAARACFRQAAEAGHTAARSRLAYCLDRGIGGARDPAGATRAWLSQRELPEGQLALGWRCESGRGTERDAVRALAWYLRAAAAGYPGAAAARSRLERALGAGERARAEQLAAGDIRMPATGADPGPQPLFPRVLSWAPRAFVVPDFLDPVERAHLITAATPHLRPSRVLQRGSGAIVSDAGRSSGEMSFLNPLRDAVVSHLEARLSRLALLPVSHGEPLVMLHYGAGDEYQTHVDYFDPAIPGREKGLQFGGQRVLTVLTYLNEPESGGETVFPEVDLMVPPRAGSALMFFSTRPDGSIDRLSRHAGAPVRSGEKWLATRWFRERPVDQPGTPGRQSAPGSYKAAFRL